MMETLDGDYQAFKANDGAYVRKHFFGKYPATAKLVEHMSDDEIWELRRGGHEPQKVYAAFHAANEHKGQPTVLLVKTVKGYGMGKAGEARTPCTRPRSCRRGHQVHPRPLQHPDPRQRAGQAAPTTSRPTTRRK
jgi:pyruvate dehydrogenase complex dehydrogenase (E1) component